MTTTIDTHCETALESPYSRDRAEAIEELAGVFPDADTDGKHRILETLREVAVESSSRDERELARETMVECFEADPSRAESVVVEALTEIARESKFSDERIDAIDALRACHRKASEQYREVIGRELAEIAGNATYEDERNRARRRLSDITRDERRDGAGSDSSEDDAGGGSDAVGYLGESLAEHLEAAAHEGPEECLQRAEEVQEFLREHRVAGESYAEVRDDVDALVEQLSVVPTGDELDEERIERVERIAARVERVYAR